MKNILLLAIFVLFNISNVLASHVPGGNITYECLGNDQYRIRLTIFEDCATSFISNSPETINISNDCGISGLTSASLNMVTYQQEISQLCPTAFSQCSGGVNPGVYMHVYEGVVTLPSQCNSWTFSYSSCCRNTSTNVTGSSQSYYWFADLNNLDAVCNTSPQFTAPPIPYNCVGQTVCYNFGIVETDGDSLSFQFVNALTGPGASVGYAGGYSGAAPIPGITIDAVTGQITFFANTQGNFVVAVQITEFDANGNIIGVVIRDIQFIVLNCANQVVDCATDGGIFNLTGGVTQTSPTSIEMCENTPFTFDVAFQDPDNNDSLSIITNINAVLPGATISFSYPNASLFQYDSIVVSVSWTPPVGSANSNNAFTITIEDNACPVSGQQTLVYYINVLGITSAYSDTVLCVNQSAILIGDSEGATSFNWTALSGDPIVVGSNFSCNNCDTVVASPSVTTVYELSTVGGACAASNKDTVTVIVVPDYTYSVALSDYNICSGNSAAITTTLNPVQSFSITWNPSNEITGDTLLSPSLNGSQEIEYQITNADGCVKIDTLSFFVSQVSFSTQVVDESCNGYGDGSLTVTGTGDYSISIYNVTGTATLSNVTGVFDNLIDGAYTIEVVDDSGCVAINNYTIAQGVIVSGNGALVSDAICFGSNDGVVQITGSAGNAPYTYVLSGLNYADTNSTGTFNVGAGAYSFEIVDNLGCVFTGTTSVFVSSPPEVISSILIDTTVGVEPFLVIFNNNSSNASNYIWTYNGSSSMGFDTTIAFNEGEYTVFLTAIEGPCEDVSSVSITVLGLSMLTVPNVFTPNDDNKNDLFEVMHKRIKAFNCIIFDRWGKKVYEFSDVTGGWDGNRKNGIKAREGVYYYVITAKGEDLVEYELSGNISLFR